MISFPLNQRDTQHGSPCFLPPQSNLIKCQTHSLLDKIHYRLNGWVYNEEERPARTFVNIYSVSLKMSIESLVLFFPASKVFVFEDAEEPKKDVFILRLLGAKTFHSESV